MFTRHLLLLFSLFLTLGATAQNEQTVVLVACQGKVKYQSPESKKYQSVESGALLRQAGVVKLQKGATAIVYGNGKFATLKAGKHALAPIFGEETSMRKLNFDSKFGEYVKSSILMAAAAQGHNAGWANLTDPQKSGDGWGVTDPKKAADGWGVTDPKKASDGWGVTDPKKASDGWGVTDPKKASDGWGGKGSKITPILPFGKVASETIHFSWSKPARADSYLVEIMDDQNRVLHRTTLRDTFADIDLKPLTLKPGMIYSWQVSVPGNDDLVSFPIRFTTDFETERTAALERLSKSELYNTSDPVTHAMMEALALENEEWYQAASDTYHRLLRENPRQNMVRMMYAAFWMRYGLRPMADAVVTTP